jgi:hypothetical protein
MSASEHKADLAASEAETTDLDELFEKGMRIFVSIYSRGFVSNLSDWFIGDGDNLTVISGYASWTMISRPDT